VGYMECIQRFVRKLHEKPNRNREEDENEYNISLNVKDIVRPSVILRYTSVIFNMLHKFKNNFRIACSFNCLWSFV
jgi:hypothetical protein